MSVLRSQKILSKSYLSRSGCGKAFFFCILHMHVTTFAPWYYSGWELKSQGRRRLAPRFQWTWEKNPFCVLYNGVLSHLYHKRRFGQYILQIPCWQSVRVRSSASVPHHHCLFFKPEEKSRLQSKEQVNKRLHLSPADTNVTAGNAGSDSRHIIARAGGARGVAAVWRSHGARSQEVKSWRSFLSKFRKVSSSPPALLIRPVNLNHEIVWILLACSEAGRIWCSCTKPDRYTILTVTSLLLFFIFLSHG